MSTITTKDGTTIYYKDWGTGPVVTLSHGWPLNSDMWDGQMLFLSQHGFRVVAHDRRGQSRESQVLKVPCGANVPRIRNHETSSLVERAKGFALRGQRGLRCRVMRARSWAGHRLQGFRQAHYVAPSVAPKTA